MIRGSYEHPILGTKKASLKDRILLSPIVKYVLPVILFIVILMTVVYVTLYFILDNGPDLWPATCHIKASYHVECFPGRKNVSFEQCDGAGCCWNDETELCFHAVPSRHGYTQRDVDSYQKNEVLVPRNTLSPLGSENVESLKLELNNIDPNHIEIIFKIKQTRTRRKRNVREERSPPKKFESDEFTKELLLQDIPENPLRKSTNIQDDEKSQMDVYVHVPEFSVTVTRKNEATSLLSTARGPFILTESFWELTLYVTNSSLYGLNQLELNGTTNWIYDNENGIARLSFLGIDDKGQSTACYVNYDGPIEIKVLDGSNLVVLRGMSLPDQLSLHVFAGSTPLEAVSQLTKALRRNTPEADNIKSASLGFHVCPNDDSEDLIDTMKKTIASMEINEAPWDSHCLHQGFNPTLGNSLDASQLKIFADAVELLGKERLLVPHLSAMLLTVDNTLVGKLAERSLLMGKATTPYLGLYRDKKVVYPDWFKTETHSESRSHLTDYLTKFATSKLLYLRDSWPKDETEQNPVPDSRRFDYIPDELKALMSNGTIPYTLPSSSGTNYHYVEHNLYAENFRNFVRAESEWMSLTTRSFWGESGISSWMALRAAIRVGVGSCLVGQLPPPMYVCGTGEELEDGDKMDELCGRWYGSAVAWPHVLALTPNLPGGKHHTPSSSMFATKHLQLRGSLVTYARTTLAKHYIEAAPILAPTSIYYPKDLQARNRWDQFFWGDSILVGLVTLPQVKQVQMWIPDKHAWRHLHRGSKVDPSNVNATSVSAAEGQIVTLVRPGFIVPLHEDISKTSAAAAKTDMTLVANLACEGDCTASGKIFYGLNSNDDVFLSITVSELNNNIELGNVLKVKERAGCNVDPTISKEQATVIKTVKILGQDSTYNVDIDLCQLIDDLTVRPLRPPEGK